MNEQVNNHHTIAHSKRKFIVFILKSIEMANFIGSIAYYNVDDDDVRLELLNINVQIKMSRSMCVFSQVFLLFSFVVLPVLYVLMSFFVISCNSKRNKTI